MTKVLSNNPSSTTLPKFETNLSWIRF